MSFDFSTLLKGMDKRQYFLIWMFVFIYAAKFLSAEEVCKISYRGQPEDINDSTIVVPENFVALSEYVQVGTPEDLVEITIATPTIFFIIDHSTSMFIQGMNDGQDKWGNRFNVTRDLIDTLYTKFPKAEVGVAVFRKYLYLDPTDSDELVKCPQQDIGAYLPLFRLDSTYTPSNEMGYEILKRWLETDTVGSTNPYVDLTYVPSNIGINDRGTNINSGFDAAKDAMLSSLYDKKFHYVIFLSDGDANQPPNNPNAYVQGTDVPTTFTIFFTRTGNPPQSIIDFTTNVKTNNYSTTNPSSNLWAFENTDYDTLMKFIMDSVVNFIDQTQTSYPVKIKVNGSIDPVDPWDSTGFNFSDLFPLTGEETDFEFEIDYLICYDSITETGDTIHVERDTTTNTEFTIKIEEGADLPQPPDTFFVECWDRTLGFYYEDNQINMADETMDELEIRFTESEVDILYGYEKVYVEISHTEGNDKERFKLKDKDDYFSYTFEREIDSTDVDPGDKILQHHSSDSIVAVFRNSKLPLDTLRISIPFTLSGAIKVTDAFYYDNADNYADGYIDTIRVKISENIEGGFTKDHLDEIENSKIITLPKHRKFTIKKYCLIDDGFAIVVEQNMDSVGPVTYVTDDDVLKIDQKILDIGGWVFKKKVNIKDRLAPIIMSAKLIDYQDLSLSDSLTVVFSEPVKDVENIKPFNFLNTEDTVEYTAELELLEPDKKTMLFNVISVDNVEYMSDGDSIWIRKGDRVGDDNEEGFINYQNMKKNQRRELKVKRIMDSFILIPYAVSPLKLNEFTKENTISDKIVKILKQSNLDELDTEGNYINGKYHGMLLQIVPKEKEKLWENFFLEGDVSLYDALGNRIISNKIMSFDKDNKTLNYVWSGKNLNSRLTGLNTYLAVFTVIPFPEGKEKKPIRPQTKMLLISIKD